VLECDLLGRKQLEHTSRGTGLDGHKSGLYTACMFDCRHRPLALPGSLVAQLAAAYGEPHRAYHDARHIDEVLGWFDRVADDVGWQQPVEVYLAIVFHDAIYQPGAKDNEARSAAWARSANVGVEVDRDRVAALIELTARHGHIEAADADAALFLDSDMAIVGAPPAAFDAYDRAIAIEYSTIPADAYRAGRRAFLAGLLAKPRIFLTDYFHARLDAQARDNLRRALAS
jgi:predicted metal-dependent HD superfamily phosphohydrolase